MTRCYQISESRAYYFRHSKRVSRAILNRRVVLLTATFHSVTTMFNPKQPQSGLRTIKRDFSSPSFGASSQPIDVDDWAPTPPVPSSTVPIKALTGSEKRLKDIQDALAGIPPQNQHRPPPLAPSSSRVINKRSNPSDFDAPPTKRRLPSSWEDTDKGTGLPSKQAIASRVQTAPKSTTKTVTTSSSTAAAKPAKVFLSQEQNQILKLVADGSSVFYTGSAGELSFVFDIFKSRAYSRFFFLLPLLVFWPLYVYLMVEGGLSALLVGTGKSVLLREIIKTLRKKHVKAPDAVAITASTGTSHISQTPCKH
jgi:ATP-dependent DNA helicase PIF1